MPLPMNPAGNQRVVSEMGERVIDCCVAGRVQPRRVTRPVANFPPRGLTSLRHGSRRIESSARMPVHAFAAVRAKCCRSVVPVRSVGLS